MRFFPFAALFSGTAWAAAAAEYGSVYFCRGASLDGECETLEIPSRRCVTTPEEWAHSVSSLAVSESTEGCEFYYGYGCVGRGFGARPSIIYLPDEHPLFDHHIESFRCYF